MVDERPVKAQTAGIDYRQVSFVALAAIALVVAAFVAPGVIGAGDSERESLADGDGGGEPIGWFDFLEWVGLTDGEGGGDYACEIQLSDEPTPGDTVTVTVRSEGEPVTDAPVWFDGESVGVTDDDGQVIGEVPYVEELEIRVQTDGETDCRIAEPTSTLEDPDSSVATAGVASVQAESPNASVEYDVDGEVEIETRGQPDPGADLEVEASIDEVAMAAADVTIDGESVAETDENGTATVTVPDDGRDRIDLGVARGEFAGTTAIDVRLLEATFSPDGLVPVPGSEGVVVVERAGEPVPDAAVFVDGDRHATTDEQGVVSLSLPVDPTTAVTVETTDQQTTITLVDVYGLPALALTAIFVGVAAVVHRTHGRRGSAWVVGLGTVFAVVAILEAFAGPTVGALSLALALGGILAVALVRSDRRPGAGRSPGGAAENALEWILTRLLAVVSVLEAVIGWGWAVVAWVVSVPQRVVGGVRASGRSRHALAGVAAVASVGVAGYVFVGDPRVVVALVGIAVLVMGGLFVRRHSRSVPVDSTDEPVRQPTQSLERTADDEPTVHTVWRQFARTVEPARWRTQAPREVERRALEAGYPEPPVRELTRLFREVEYGPRRATPELHERAGVVYAALVDGGENPSSATDSDQSSSETDDEDERHGRRPAGDRT